MEPLDNVSKENKSELFVMYTKIGGMEIFSGNEVNPGCMPKILMLEFPRVSPTNKTKIKKLKTCKIKKTQRM